MYFDTHAHYDDEQFNEDRHSLLKSMPENGVELIVNPATNLNSAAAAVSLAETHPFLYAAVGFHPHDASLMEKGSLDRLKAFSKHEKVVAVGEIGLDYYYDLSPREVQKKRFYEQMELARDLGLPVIIHERDACQDCLAVIKDFPDVLGVFHCFSGSWETAKTILNQGWYLSFTGIVTFKNARRALEVLEKMPRDRVMIETDSPYLAPVPNRGRRNSSLNLPYIAEAVGKAIGISAEETARLTLENGKRFFRIS